MKDKVLNAEDAEEISKDAEQDKAPFCDFCTSSASSSFEAIPEADLLEY
jgi:hypothetical protein